MQATEDDVAAVLGRMSAKDCLTEPMLRGWLQEQQSAILLAGGDRECKSSGNDTFLPTVGGGLVAGLWHVLATLAKIRWWTGLNS